MEDWYVFRDSKKTNVVFNGKDYAAAVPAARGLVAPKGSLQHSCVRNRRAVGEGSQR